MSQIFLQKCILYCVTVFHLLLLMNITNIICGQIFSSVDARVGLERTAYIVNENTGVVEICARVFEPSIPCPIDFAFNLTIDTIDGTAGICVYV